MMAETSSQRMLARLDELGGITDEPGQLTRTFLSPAMHRANERVGGWMRKIGCEVTEDGWGNLIGHLAGTEAGAKTLLLGSHLDTVRNAGKYDGPLGIVVAIEALAELAAAGVRLPYHIDLLGFSDEEGTRFQSAYLGSKALAGLVKEGDLSLRDAMNVTVAEAVQRFRGETPMALPKPRYQPEDLLGYVELHIEQGPVLQELNRPLGVVEYIAAQHRYLYTVQGCAGHAGTTPMKLRRDALAGAAEFILFVEKLARDTSGLVATVGMIEAGPGVSNVIPDRVRFTVDIRHASDEALEHATQAMEPAAAELASRRGLEMASTLIQATPSVPCAPRLIAELASAIEREVGTPAPRLVSGAGHDGVILSRLTDVGMIFVRCQDGLSHHPLESVREDDIAAAQSALSRFLRQLA